LQDKLIKKIILMVGIIAVLGVASSSVVLSSPASAQKGPEFIPASAQKGPDFIPGRYIVVLQDGVSPQDVIRGHGVVPDFVYSHALNGFSAPISPKLLDELKQDPRVVHIEQDQKVYAFSQTLPTGIDRIDAEPASSPSSFAGDVTVAIIDTGIDDHPDLNVFDRVNCAKKGPLNNICFPDEGDDGNGHGTHVAGTVAARDNGAGVVGVVPGADLWAVKVLGNDGSGWMSWVIAGVDYVTANANSIDVANMSLGGSYSQALNDAVENSISAGVVYAVAAGNASDDAANYSPASAPNAITVSAVVDTDGMCGGQGSSTSYGADDTFASFSNDGSIVDIAAPGVSILSTYKDGGYAYGSGTSMASPHVAGAAALYIYTNGKPTDLNGVTDVRDALVLNGIPQTQESCTAGTGNGPFSGDPDNYAEPLVYVSSSSVGYSPTVSISSPAEGSSYHVGEYISFIGTASDTEDGDLTASLGWNSDLDGSIGMGGSFLATLSEGSHTITASVTDSHLNSGSASISISVVNDSPTVIITSPADVSTFDSGATILFEGTASDTEDGDLTASLAWSSDLDGSIGIVGGSFSTILSDGVHTITAAVTDSGEKTGSTTISITVGDAPTIATTVSVDSIMYTTHGGKDGSKHLDITITIINDFTNTVSGASVSITLKNIDTGGSWSGTATTGSDGTVTFTLNNAASGHYETDVTNVIASGLTFVDDYVDVGYDK